MGNTYLLSEEYLYSRCTFHVLNRESGESPGRSRRCKEEIALFLPLSLDGKAYADNESEAEDLPWVEVRKATSDRPHEVLPNRYKRLLAFLS